MKWASKAFRKIIGNKLSVNEMNINERKSENWKENVKKKLEWNKNIVIGIRCKSSIKAK